MTEPNISMTLCHLDENLQNNEERKTSGGVWEKGMHFNCTKKSHKTPEYAIRFIDITILYYFRITNSNSLPFGIKIG
jgi:hypothetical protein